jgi:hypothetical protein
MGNNGRPRALAAKPSEPSQANQAEPLGESDLRR